MQQVASYLISLQGSKPLNPKAPQGEKEEKESKDEGNEKEHDSTAAVQSQASL
jgi:hypothetical protein